MKWFITEKQEFVLIRLVVVGPQNVWQVHSCGFNHFVCCEIQHQPQWADDPEQSKELQLCFILSFSHLKSWPHLFSVWLFFHLKLWSSLSSQSRLHGHRRPAVISWSSEATARVMASRQRNSVRILVSRERGSQTFSSQRLLQLLVEEKVRWMKWQSQVGLPSWARPETEHSCGHRVCVFETESGATWQPSIHLLAGVQPRQVSPVSKIRILLCFCSNVPSDMQ